MLADERARGARVVEVNVRKQQVPEVAQLEPVLAQALLQLGHAAGRAAVEERGAFPCLDQVAPDHPLAPEVAQVERLELGHTGDANSVSVSDTGRVPALAPAASPRRRRC